MKLLDVWRDLYDRYDRAGMLILESDEVRYQYHENYEGEPISVSLPLQRKPFTSARTRTFFSALNPEGPTRQGLITLIRADADEYESLIARLNDESIGALLFSASEEPPGSKSAYQPLDREFFDLFADTPTETAINTMAQTRLSLSGAMAKVGLYCDPNDGTWHLPLGAAPSTHIIKAESKLFPHEILNEAMCLDVARRCDFPVAQAEIIVTRDGNHLLSVERYDRTIPDKPRLIGGHPAPMRLHQEDFCQVCALDGKWKYEPTEGAYLRRIASSASRYCANSFGEAQLALNYVFFDYLIGNCDNHLKNFSLLYGNDWRTREMAPLYDVLNTTLYPNLLTEMGVSLSPSRSIFDLTRTQIENAIGDAGLPVSLGMSDFDDLAAHIVGALEESRDYFIAQGFESAKLVGNLLIDGARKRSAFDYSSATAKTIPSS